MIWLLLMGVGVALVSQVVALWIVERAFRNAMEKLRLDTADRRIVELPVTAALPQRYAPDPDRDPTKPAVSLPLARRPEQARPA